MTSASADAASTGQQPSDPSIDGSRQASSHLAAPRSWQLHSSAGEAGVAHMAFDTVAGRLQMPEIYLKLGLPALCGHEYAAPIGADVLQPLETLILGTLCRPVLASDAGLRLRTASSAEPEQDVQGDHRESLRPPAW